MTTYLDLMGLGPPGGMPVRGQVPGQTMPMPGQMPMGLGPLAAGPGMAPTAAPGVPSFGAPPMENAGFKGGGQAGSAVTPNPDQIKAIANFMGMSGAKPPGAPGTVGDPLSLTPPAPAAKPAPQSEMPKLDQMMAGIKAITPPEAPRVGQAPGGGASGGFNGVDLNSLLKMLISGGGAPSQAKLPSLGELIGR